MFMPVFRGNTILHTTEPQSVQRELVSELRIALDVMEEYSKLGLDDEAASKLREVLVRLMAAPPTLVSLAVCQDLSAFPSR